MIVKSDAPKYPLRIPLEVKLAIEKSAKENGRSINTEMVMRLVDSLRRDSSKGNLAKVEAPTAVTVRASVVGKSLEKNQHE